MLRTFTSLCVLSLLAVQPALAEEKPGADFAEYAVLLGASPFGGSLSFAYNESPKTTWLFVLGGTGGVMPDMTDVDISGDKYSIHTDASWVGFFVNHRPLASAQWLRLAAGIGIGSIENTLETPQKDAGGNDETATYRVDYSENPVGYLGVGFGAEPRKGLMWALDIGWLQTAGPDVQQVSGDPTVEGADYETRRGEILDSVFFGNFLPNIMLTVGYGF